MTPTGGTWGILRDSGRDKVDNPGSGPDSGMEEALMKQEPEVIACPRGGR